MTKQICSIYKSKKKEGYYLYVKKQEGFEKVPDALKDMFGTAELAFTLLLTPEKKLARASAEAVLNSLEEKGYYLQMPPVDECYMQEINQHNSKL